jgi:hypothetical protein
MKLRGFIISFISKKGVSLFSFWQQVDWRRTAKELKSSHEDKLGGEVWEKVGISEQKPIWQSW